MKKEITLKLHLMIKKLKKIIHDFFWEYEEVVEEYSIELEDEDENKE